MPQQGVPVAIGDQSLDFEAPLLQVVLIPVFGKATAVVIGRHMDIRGKWSGEDQDAARLEQAGEFIQRMGRLGHMLEHFATEDGIKAGIGCGDRGDVADQIDA